MTLMYSFKYKTRKDRNAAVILITSYIYAVWLSKKKNYTKEKIIIYSKSKLYYDRWLMIDMYKDD